MVNVMACSYQEFVQFCHKNKIEMRNARFIRSIEHMFGQWQGDLYVLHPVQTRKTTQFMLQEAARRGLTIKYRDVAGNL